MRIIGFSSGAVGRESNADRMVKALLDKCEGPSEFVKLTKVGKLPADHERIGISRRETKCIISINRGNGGVNLSRFYS